MAQLFVTVITRQLSTLPNNTVQNPKKDGHSMTINTRGGNQTIDPPMSSNEEKVIKDNDTVVQVSGEVEDNKVKDAELPKMVTPMPRQPTPFLED